MAFSISFDLSNLKDLNTFLESRSYVVGCVAAGAMSPTHH